MRPLSDLVMSNNSIDVTTTPDLRQTECLGSAWRFKI
jgi:hypothetical protein